MFIGFSVDKKLGFFIIVNPIEFLAFPSLKILNTTTNSIEFIKKILLLFAIKSSQVQSYILT